MLRRLLAVLLIAGAAAGPAVAAVASASPRVKVSDDYFSVRRLTVHRGTRVTWTWGGFLNHNVTVLHGPAHFHSRTQATGSFSHLFTVRGTYTLYCTIHQFMRMTVVVR